MTTRYGRVTRKTTLWSTTTSCRFESVLVGYERPYAVLIDRFECDVKQSHPVVISELIYRVVVVVALAKAA